MSKYEEFLDVLLKAVKDGKAVVLFMCKSYVNWKSDLCSEDVTTMDSDSDELISDHIAEILENYEE